MRVHTSDFCRSTFVAQQKSRDFCRRHWCQTCDFCCATKRATKRGKLKIWIQTTKVQLLCCWYYWKENVENALDETEHYGFVPGLWRGELFCKQTINLLRIGTEISPQPNGIVTSGFLEYGLSANLLCNLSKSTMPKVLACRKNRRRIVTEINYSKGIFYTSYLLNEALQAPLGECWVQWWAQTFHFHINFN